MKANFLFATLMILSSCVLFAEIRNGYEAGLHSAIAALQQLSTRLSSDKNLSLLEKQIIRSEIKKVTDIISHYELTRQLINQFRIVSPVIYSEMDTISDKRNRPTDIFIKLIPYEYSRVQLMAASFFRQSPRDRDASFSEYGEHSVSVNICIGQNTLQLLSHELGHIRYVVPNLATYASFYMRYYQKEIADFSCVGHSPFDESGKTAMSFEQRFRADLAYYLINGGMKFESTASLIERIRRNSRKPGKILHPELSFAWAFARR
ncbi:MAG TPA: hypothetical protein VFG46_00010 [Chryseolinea sp.]|nr:hypothetical protein [Chryseolinea sp.]